jgi:ABC-type dipeptide/oligopeptide/nickel transport system permease component
MIERRMAELDDAKREKILQDAQRMAFEDVAIIPLHIQTNIWAMRRGRPAHRAQRRADAGAGRAPGGRGGGAVTVYLLRRLIQAAGVVLAMSVIVFIGVYAIGDPVEILISPDADQFERERAIKALGLDLPLWEQYLTFLGKALQGDLGRSFVFNEPALKLILQRMPATLELAIGATVVALLIGVPLGLYAGLKPDSPVSKGVMAASILGFSLPTFWVGLMLILVFAVQLGWLPSTGRGETVECSGCAGAS